IQQTVRPVAIGSLEALEMANEFSGTGLALRKIDQVAESSGDPGVLEVVDTGQLPPGNVTLGEATAVSGKAQLAWIVEADQIC
ncbi:MAG TPA: 4-hydroxythreonine-4-phosphate dehydrogenase, partial [Gammaproteobacteria bacterium]|nr:4-hydroxythreonine-4-phosphate dehydrogenase [Gammaproteobacteria bacterium]